MSGLAHYLEAEGLSTAAICLVREHAQAIKPPRALWVPFELGHPLGAPNNPGFQHKVLAAALDLFEAQSGPLLKDFPEESPVEGPADLEGWSCPVDFSPPPAELSKAEQLTEAVLSELNQLGTWHDLFIKEYGRTSMGPSGLEPMAIGEFLCGFLEGGRPAPPRDDLDLAWLVKLCSEDLKVYYLESAMAKPGSQEVTSTTLNDWFWGQTAAGRLLLELKKIFMQKDDEASQLIGRALIVPVAQAHRQKDS